MRLLQESRGQQTSTYIYEPGSYVPLARIDGTGAIEPHPAAAHALGGDAEQGKQGSVPTTNPQWADRFNVAAAANDEPGGSNTRNVREGTDGEDIAQVYYFHTQPNGLPEELSDNSGNLVWQAQYTTWGGTVREDWQSFDSAGRPQQQLANQTASLHQNLRMQGQYLDRETGLHYNTFRYYDADLGAFTTPDPIGLLGGLNLHQYAPNPIAWIDPWGWARDCGQQVNRPKPVSLPSARKTKVDMAHVLDRHTASGKTAQQSGKKDLFPENMTPKKIERSIKEAYGNGKRIQTQGERALVQGKSGGKTIEMWVNTKTKIIETAYPKS
ncbi:RHS domain-containing protein [Acidovorax sp. LjRoot129]|uniref:RHS repeat-associated core domain-containing protein n=1 Tax=Acidovorax sp. LjRoot129 TaxID=3342260 RepID=UPI003ECCFDAC